ncbi:MAG: hypothetical protein H6624_18305 [Bdellovibrionaceae bacterium]|nr:hypothetical protein [Bdellovibrionales bacterium]MCB9086297.1 hypothetical protein [Pseudobdellovibrionaceae bacterium]
MKSKVPFIWESVDTWVHAQDDLGRTIERRWLSNVDLYSPVDVLPDKAEPLAQQVFFNPGLIQNLNISLIENVQAEYVMLEFVPVGSIRHISGNNLPITGTAFKKRFVPFYNGKKTQAPMYSQNISMYVKKSLYEILDKTTNLFPHFQFNDASLPFGGEFSLCCDDENKPFGVHGQHRTGMEVDVRAFGSTDPGYYTRCTGNHHPSPCSGNKPGEVFKPADGPLLAIDFKTVEGDDGSCIDDASGEVVATPDCGEVLQAVDRISRWVRKFRMEADRFRLFSDPSLKIHVSSGADNTNQAYLPSAMKSKPWVMNALLFGVLPNNIPIRNSYAAEGEPSSEVGMCWDDDLRFLERASPFELTLEKAYNSVFNCDLSNVRFKSGWTNHYGHYHLWLVQ